MDNQIEKLRKQLQGFDAVVRGTKREIKEGEKHGDVTLPQ